MDIEEGPGQQSAQKGPSAPKKKGRSTLQTQANTANVFTTPQQQYPRTSIFDTTPPPQRNPTSNQGSSRTDTQPPPLTGIESRSRTSRNRPKKNEVSEEDEIRPDLPISKTKAKPKTKKKPKAARPTSDEEEQEVLVHVHEETHPESNLPLQEKEYYSRFDAAELTTNQIVAAARRKIPRRDENEDEVPNQPDREKTIHTALVDSRDDEAQRLTIPEGGVQALEGELAYSRQVKGKTNVAYDKQARRVKRSAPDARIMPKEGIPARMLYQAFASDHGDEKQLTSTALLLKHKQAKLTQQKSISAAEISYRRQQVDLRPRFKKVLDAAEKYASMTMLEVLEMMNNLVKGNPTLVDMRRICGDLYYIPNNITKKAMQCFASDAIARIDQDLPGIRYGLPSREQALAVAKLFAFDSIEDLEHDIEEGIKMSELQKLKLTRFERKSMSQTRKENQPLVHQLNAVREAVETRRAEQRFKDDDDLNEQIEFVGPNLKDVEVEDVEREQLYYKTMNIAVSKANSEHKWVPLTYTVKYTYKFLYYLHLNDQGTAWPLGRSIPPLSWVYIMALHLDPSNRYGMRLDIKAYTMKIGGLGLVMKNTASVSAAPSDLAELVTSSISGASDTSSIGSVIVGACSQLVRLQAKTNMLAEVEDELSDAYEMMTHAKKSALQVQRSPAANNCPALLAVVSQMEELLTTVLDPLSLSEQTRAEILKRVGVQIDTNRLQASDVLGPLSYTLQYMAAFMYSQAQLINTNDTSHLSWFIDGLQAAARGEESSFSYILKAIERPKLNSVNIALFGSQNKLDKVKSAISQAQSILRDDIPRVLAMSLDNKFKSKGINLEWSSILSKAVAAENANISKLVIEAASSAISTSQQKPRPTSAKPDQEVAVATEAAGHLDISNFTADLDEQENDPLRLMTRKKFAKKVVRHSINQNFDWLRSLIVNESGANSGYSQEVAAFINKIITEYHPEMEADHDPDAGPGLLDILSQYCRRISETSSSSQIYLQLKYLNHEVKKALKNNDEVYAKVTRVAISHLEIGYKIIINI